jgi:serine/threonine protein kinase
LIYKGIDLQTNTPVFIKCVNWLPESAGKYLRREYDFLTQVALPFQAKRLPQHSYFEVGIDPEIVGLKVAFLVLPWLEGLDSERWIEVHGVIEEAKVVEWVTQLLPCLEELEDMGYIHRDIKPSNIMINNDHLTLIDYGFIQRLDDAYLSRITERAYNESTRDYERMTRIVSSGYTPPEQMRGLALPQSDFYALGRTIIYWLTGENPNEIIGFENFSPVWESFPELSSTFTDFIDRLLAPKPEKRPLKASNIRYFFAEVYPNKLAAEKRARSKSWAIARYGLVSLGLVGIGTLGVYGWAQYLNYQGSQALISGNIAQARQKFEASLRLNPRNVAAQHNLGVACQELRDNDCALKSFQAAISLQPKKSYPYYQLGILKEDLGDMDGAKQYYQTALAKDPRNIYAINRLARVELLADNTKEAEMLIQSGLRLKPNNDLKSELLKNLGWLYFKQGNLPQAKESLQTAIELDASHADPFCLVAQVEEKLGNVPVSQAHWAACLEMPSDKPEVTQWREEILRKIFNLQGKI